MSAIGVKRSYIQGARQPSFNKVRLNCRMRTMAYLPPELTEQIATQIAATLGDSKILDQNRIAFAVRQAANSAFADQAPPTTEPNIKKAAHNIGSAKIGRCLSPGDSRLYGTIPTGAGGASS